MIEYCFQCKYFDNQKCLIDNQKVDESYPYCKYGYKDSPEELSERIKLEEILCQEKL